jgi:late competence protein required for DNA uptake (superfamily II DNA/RNA helicase)
MPFRTDDPVADFVRHDWKQAKWLERLPTCERCGNRIEQEWAVCIDGVWYCDDCIEAYKREVIQDE